MTDEQHLKRLVDLAGANSDLILRGKSHAAALAEIIGGNDIVWGVWQDKSCPNGVDSMIIKGRGRLMLIGQSKLAVTVKMTAVPCREFAEAEAMCQVFGDGRAKRG